MKSEWINNRQMQQQIQVQKAYAEVKKKDEFSEIKMDGIDQAYVWARTFTPSWVMGVIFLAGLITLAPLILKRFGLSFKLEKRMK